MSITLLKSRWEGRLLITRVLSALATGMSFQNFTSKKSSKIPVLLCSCHGEIYDNCHFFPPVWSTYRQAQLLWGSGEKYEKGKMKPSSGGEFFFISS